ncbi:Cu(I)-responsive transcriptional regulator [Cognatishimia activa]|uniref:Cu(I)-responsive transcriptional regulator n=1 Tax=Cognatishimia activa TaxID=1715691 RepID=UPI002230990C|nr:Cu(I)-responsive transcriptional regulator [Cognatishimia activa]UZD89993.1 Cu(I)-responsive transcriptional regulator [Cognatishimia activa]
MNIGDISDATGLPSKTIRYYEDIGLVIPKRASNGYRQFTESDLHHLRFLARARRLGFSIDSCRQLLSLYDKDDRESAEVRKLAVSHMQEIERKIAELNGMHETLAALVNACAGDHRPDCPILNDLAGAEAQN